MSRLNETFDSHLFAAISISVALCAGGCHTSSPRPLAKAADVGATPVFVAVTVREEPLTYPLNDVGHRAKAPAESQAAAVTNANVGGMALSLENSVLRFADGKVSQTFGANIHVRFQDGHWTDGIAFAHNRGAHTARIGAMTQTADTMRFDVDLLLGADSWVPAAVATYRVNLKNADDGQWTGTWKGVWAYSPLGPREMEGKASMRFLPSPPHAGSARGAWESPLLLFRKSDLPRLRERMATPFGKVLTERMAQGDAVCRGVMYQLTGDKSHAQAARTMTEKTMAERGGGAFAVGRIWGDRAYVVAVAYDLCRDAWDEPFRRQVEWYLDWIVRKAILKPWTISNAVNLNPGSNYMVVIYGGAAIAALTRVGERTSEPSPPDERFLKFITIAPPADYRVPEGFPVETLKPGMPPSAWVYAGHWPETEMTVEAVARALPATGPTWSQWTVGQSFQIGKRSFTLRSLKDSEYYPNPGGPKQINLTEVCTPPDKDKEKSYFHFGAFATALTIPEEMVLRSEVPGSLFIEVPGSLFIGGERLETGDCFVAKPGAYPVVFVANSDELYGTPWGHTVLAPKFARIEEADLKRLLAGREIEYGIRRRLWEDDVRVWKANGGLDAARFNLVQRGAHLCRRSLQNAMGDGGFQAEGESYTLECIRPLLDYALIYRTVFGEDLSARSDASHFAARYCFTTLWDFPGKGGRTVPFTQHYGGGSGIMAADYLGRCYPLTPDAWKPALQWYWLRSMGVTEQEMRTGEGVAKAFGKWEANAGLAYAFLNYPLDATPRNPGEVFPKAWVADGKGFFAFRNAWTGGDDIVAQFHAKNGNAVGWHSPEAGTFQLVGLGHEWAAKGVHDRGGYRWLENVVLMPEDDLNVGAYGKVFHREVDTVAGRGSIAVDMNELYKVLKPKPNAAKGEGPMFVDGGIRGRRAFAADLSGKAGAPAVIAVVDTISGGGKKVWQMFVPSLTAQAVTTQGNRFIITKGSATLCGTVVSPVGATITAVIPPDGTKPDPKSPDAAFRGIRIQGADPKTGDFWVVLTLQNGDAPVVETQGVGLATKVRIGNTALRFADGTLIWE